MLKGNTEPDVFGVFFDKPKPQNMADEIKSQ